VFALFGTILTLSPVKVRFSYEFKVISPDRRRARLHDHSPTRRKY